MSSGGVCVAANSICPALDGARLATDVFRPDCDGRVPAVLLRTPYGRGAHADEGLGWVRHGFAFVVQDTRGRGDSDGTFEPYAHEASDGLAALEWVRAQPWCSGDVFMVGGSYAAFCGWAVAVARPAGLRGLISLVPAMGTHRTAFTASGILNLGDHVWWWSSFAEGRGERKRLVDLMLTYDASVLMHLPVVDLGKRLWVRLSGWSTVVEQGPGHVPAWAITDESIARVEVPVLHIGGWHDPFIRETLAHAATAGSAARPRPRQDLVVGPWTHTMGFNSPVVGVRDYGPAASLPLGQLMVDWLREVLAGQEAGRSHLFIGGVNCWRDDVWPAGAGGELLLYAAGEGRLAPAAPPTPAEESFVDDPLQPFPSCSQPLDVTATLERRDALRFLTEPLERPLAWAGTPVVVLTGSTDAASCDWLARLVEVQPDGRAVYITHGIVEATAAMGSRCQVRIALAPCAIAIPPGSRLCLEIAGSYFPEHARNLHAGDRYRGHAARPALQRVLLDGSTYVVLPVIPV
jgi:putative CocE/NonD family hydrolase